MIASQPNGHSPPSAAGLALLLQAYEYARELACSPWDFAVEIQTLKDAGLTNSDLRWLLHEGHAEHAHERPRGQGKGRTFLPGGLRLTDWSCFVLTAAGEAPARAAVVTHKSPASAGPPEVPYWDAALRELWVGDVLVKAFSRPAPNQEIILAAFEPAGSRTPQP
jgi:hypothetical protein